jgi:hypothetical protein
MYVLYVEFPIEVVKYLVLQVFYYLYTIMLRRRCHRGNIVMTTGLPSSSSFDPVLSMLDTRCHYCSTYRTNSYKDVQVLCRNSSVAKSATLATRVVAS